MLLEIEEEGKKLRKRGEEEIHVHSVYIVHESTPKMNNMPIHYLCSILLLSISSQAVQLLAIELSCPAVVLLMSLLCCAPMLPEVCSLENIQCR